MPGRQPDTVDMTRLYWPGLKWSLKQERGLCVRREWDGEIMRVPLCLERRVDLARLRVKCFRQDLIH